MKLPEIPFSKRDVSSFATILAVPFTTDPYAANDFITSFKEIAVIFELSDDICLKILSESFANNEIFESWFQNSTKTTGYSTLDEFISKFHDSWCQIEPLEKLLDQWDQLKQYPNESLVHFVRRSIVLANGTYSCLLNTSSLHYNNGIILNRHKSNNIIDRSGINGVSFGHDSNSNIDQGICCGYAENNQDDNQNRKDLSIRLLSSSDSHSIEKVLSRHIINSMTPNIRNKIIKSRPELFKFRELIDLVSKIEAVDSIQKVDQKKLFCSK